MAIGDQFLGELAVPGVVGLHALHIANYRAVQPNADTQSRMFVVPYDCEVVAVRCGTDTDNNDGTALTVQLRNNSTTTNNILTTALDLFVDGSTTRRIVSSTDIVTAQRALTAGQFVQTDLIATGNAGAARNFDMWAIVRVKTPSSGAVVAPQ